MSGTALDALRFVADNLDEIIAAGQAVGQLADLLFFRFMAGINQSVFEGVDLNGRTLLVPGEKAQVYVNRVPVVQGKDYVLEAEGARVRFTAPLKIGAEVQISCFAFMPDGMIYFDHRLDPEAITELSAAVGLAVSTSQGNAAAAQIAANSAASAATAADQGADRAEAARAAVAGLETQIVSNTATIARRSSGTWHLADYLHPTDLAAAVRGDLAGQDVARVTLAIQTMHQDAITTWLDYPNGAGRCRIEYINGALAINDEMFNEATAEMLWPINWAAQKSRLVFDFKNLVVHPRFASNVGIRTSGYYKEFGINYPVPKCIFRLMREAPSPTYMAEFHGTLRVYGEKNFYTDPIGFYVSCVNDAHGHGDMRFQDLYNFGLIIESHFNSRYENMGGNSGFQLTEFGGALGQIPATATFSVNGAVVTASENVFNQGHVGRKLAIALAGPLNAGDGIYMPYWGTISSVESATQATLDTAAPRAVTGSRASFEAVTGSISAGSNVLTLSASFTGNLVGRLITIVGTYPDGKSHFGSLLTATIIAQSGSQMTLSIPAGKTVSNAPVSFAATAHVAPTDVCAIAELVNNDMLHLPRLWCEDGGYQNKASVSLVVSGVHIDIDGGTKIHGSGTNNSNNWGGNFANLICGLAKQLRFCGTSTHGHYSPKFGKHIFAGKTIDVVLEGESNSYPSAPGSADVYLMPEDGYDRFRVYHDMSLYGFGGDGFNGQVTARGRGSVSLESMLLARGTPRRSDDNRLVQASSEFYKINVASNVKLDGTTYLNGFVTGSSVATDFLDGTVGKIMKVGHGALSGVQWPAVTSDFDAASGQSARWRSETGTLHLPIDGTGWIVDNTFSSGLNFQTAISSGFNSRVRRAVRHNNTTGNVFSPWTFFQMAAGGTTRPTTPVKYEAFFDETLNKPIWWNGTAWVDATGATV